MGLLCRQESGVDVDYQLRERDPRTAPRYDSDPTAVPHPTTDRVPRLLIRPAQPLRQGPSIVAYMRRLVTGVNDDGKSCVLQEDRIAFAEMVPGAGSSTLFETSERSE